MPRVKVAHLLERQLQFVGLARLGRDHFDQERNVIAAIRAVQDGGRGPALALGQNGRTMQAARPFALSELVDLITRHLPEQLGQLPVGAPEEVHHQDLGALRDAVGGVGFREADQHPGGLDTRLCHKPD